MDKNQAARELFLEQSFGVLSTISLDVPGYPFGSVTPYCVDDECRPILYISTIAQHTKNILADSRVSLTVVEPATDSDDVQARSRVTCLGRATPVQDSASDEVRSRYIRYFPEAAAYDQTHDFLFFRLDLVRVRFIGGFGQIYWVEPDEFLARNPFSSAQQQRIIEHMNTDHRDALRHYTGGHDAVMTGIDANGFDVLRSAKKIRFRFDTPVRNMEDARRALVAMAQQPQ
jgi:heme oxygenase (biliverdin-IX-beta and delta-forming)